MQGVRRQKSELEKKFCYQNNCQRDVGKIMEIALEELMFI